MGYGKKTDFANRRRIPSPNSYNVESEFDRIGRMSKTKGGIRFRLGRYVNRIFAQVLFFRK